MFPTIFLATSRFVIMTRFFVDANVVFFAATTHTRGRSGAGGGGGGALDAAEPPNHCSANFHTRPLTIILGSLTHSITRAITRTNQPINFDILTRDFSVDFYTMGARTQELRGRYPSLNLTLCGSRQRQGWRHVEWMSDSSVKESTNRASSSLSRPPCVTAWDLPGAALVRPDAIVAWAWRGSASSVTSSDKDPHATAAQLEHVLQRFYARPT
jgi:hypothetical protein